MNKKQVSIVLLFSMWVFQLVLSGLVVLVIRNIIFDIPIANIFNSVDNSIRGDWILVDYLVMVVAGTYATLFLWARIVLKKNLASREWLIEMLGEDIVRYLRIPKK